MYNFSNSDSPILQADICACKSPQTALGILELSVSIFKTQKFCSRSRNSNNRGSDLRYDLSITLEEAYSGKKQNIQFSTSEKCSTCKGNGSKPGSSPDRCTYCGGNGRVRSNQGFFTVQQTCPQCSGSGEEITNPCSNCNGQGNKQTTKKLYIFTRFP